MRGYDLVVLATERSHGLTVLARTGPSASQKLSPVDFRNDLNKANIVSVYTVPVPETETPYS
jgi:hypothetical protein